MRRTSVFVLLLLLTVPTTGKSAEFASELISVKSLGSGPDMLLIHGFASTSIVWADVKSRLATTHRLHLVDINGFAGKPPVSSIPESYIIALRDELIRYIDSQKLNEPDLVGHSMGGLLSLLVGGASQRSVGKIIVVDALPFYSLMFNPNATADQVTPMAKAMEKQLLQMDEAEFEAQAKRSISILTKVSDKHGLLLEWSRTSNRKAYSQMIREVTAFDGRDEIVGIESAVFVIYAYDKRMPLSMSELDKIYRNAYESIGDVEFMRIDDSYHFIMWDQPEAFYGSLRKVLSTGIGEGP